MNHTSYYIGPTKVKDLVILGELYEVLPDFSSSLTILYRNHPKRDIIGLLDRLSHGQQPVFVPTDVTSFYNKYKKELDIMNGHGGITPFLSTHFENDGTIRRFSPIKKYAMYMNMRKDKMDRIKELISEIERLGIDFIVMDSAAQFEEEQYTLNRSLSSNKSITYLANIEITPNYNPEIIKYHSPNSDYKIVSRGFNLGILPLQDTTITVKSLLFNPTTLPPNIDECQMHKEILSKKDAKEKACQQVTTAIGLNVGADELLASTQTLIELVNSNMESSTTRGERISMNNALSAIQESILDLQTATSRYEGRIMREDTTITPETLQEEKKAYAKKLRRI